MPKQQKKEKKGFFSDKRYLAFIIPVAVMLLTCIVRGIYPFGTRSFLRTDMYNQYMPFFTEFLDKLQTGDSLLYSWHAGIGTNFCGLYAYYLASPLNWLLLLCPKAYVIEFMTLLIMLKTGLSGYFFAWYLKKHTALTAGFPGGLPVIAGNGKMQEMPIREMADVMFALFYALSGFWAAYNWNIMWMDVICLAPVVILGLEELVLENKTTLYYLSLSLAIISNYYLCIMLCIFLVLYYAYMLCMHPSKWQSVFNFFLYSLLAGGTGAIVMLPEMMALKVTKFSKINFPDTIKFYFNFLEEMTRMCLGVKNELMLEHWPNLYSGVAVLFLVVLFVLDRKIPKRSRLIRVSLIGFFWLSFSCNVLDFIWHGLHYPDSLPSRQSYLYTFLLLTMCYEVFWHLPQMKIWKLAVAFAMAFGLVGLGFFFNQTEYYEPNHAYPLTALFLGIYLLLLIMYRYQAKWRIIALWLAFLTTITEVGVNTMITSIKTTSRSTYMDQVPEMETLLARTEAEDETVFYRVEDKERLTKNDAMKIGFNSASIFSSTTHYPVAAFYKEMGMLGSKTFYCNKGATPLANAMLSVKYLISDSPDESNTLRKLVDSEGDVYLYENRYWLPLGYAVDEHLSDYWDYEETGAITTQNRLAEAFGIDADLYTLTETKDLAEGKKSVTATRNGYYYITCLSSGVDTVTAVYENREDEKKKFTKVYQEYLLDLGYLEAGETVTLSATARKTEEPVEDLSLKSCILNENILSELIGKMGEHPLVVDSYTSTTVEGHISVPENRLLVTSIPHEEGWELYVDGVKTPITVFEDAYISVNLTKGDHTIKLQYHALGLNWGIGISLICFGIFLFNYIMKKKEA
ncbi:MAG: YfhO family protein [Lachnospiraceae bacterium]|nr:YfhO family protein [Lachnospiraceae bacterium]